MHVLADWLLTPQRLAIHRPTGTAVVADLHLGYDRARRRSGEAVPAEDLNKTLHGLKSALRVHGLTRLVIAGDLFEAGRHAREIANGFSDWLAQTGIELVGFLPGNHDAGLEEWPGRHFFEGLRLGCWKVIHGDGTLPRGRLVHGHFHPCLRRSGISAPCYLVGERRLVLPAYSRDAAGVNVLGVPAWQSYRCVVIAGEQVLDFGLVGELNRRLRLRAPREAASGNCSFITSTESASNRGSSRSC